MSFAKNKKLFTVMSLFLVGAATLLSLSLHSAVASAQADENPSTNTELSAEDVKKGYVDQCGKGDRAVKIKFNFNCIGENYRGDLNPIIDLMFALIRTLSFGVGILLVIMIVISGIRYSASQGDPQAIAKAIAGIRNAVISLLFYFLAYALLQWLVPGGVFNSTPTSSTRVPTNITKVEVLDA